METFKTNNYEKAKITKEGSKAYGKEVFIKGNRGRLYYCSFSKDGKAYPFMKWDLEFIK